jgi:hypothetical protein
MDSTQFSRTGQRQAGTALSAGTSFWRSTVAADGAVFDALIVPDHEGQWVVRAAGGLHTHRRSRRADGYRSTGMRRGEMGAALKIPADGWDERLHRRQQCHISPDTLPSQLSAPL